LADPNSDSDTDSIDTSIDASGILDNPDSRAMNILNGARSMLLDIMSLAGNVHSNNPAGTQPHFHYLARY
jgi:hypothetical protein